jgi:F-type H+-transporting ATPase subunit gamma
MEMVSAAKMRRAVASVLGIRPYAHSAWSVLTNLARAFETYGTGLLEVREVKSVLMVIVTSNRGLCGSFNAQVMKKIRQELLDPSRMMVNRVGTKRIESKVSPEDLKIDFLTIGRKGENMVRKMKKNIVATFTDLMFMPKSEEVRKVAKVAMDDYLARKYDKVVIVYTDYISAINQQTKIRQILPISKMDIEKQIAEMDTAAGEYGLKEPQIEYKVEPSPQEILEFIFPRLIEMQIYHAILESNASKESSRMLAMRSATDAAGEMVNGLTLMYNQIRQQKITQEIAEISAGRAALEQ